jgi:hypothetical protein
MGGKRDATQTDNNKSLYEKFGQRVELAYISAVNG